MVGRIQGYGNPFPSLSSGDSIATSLSRLKWVAEFAYDGGGLGKGGAGTLFVNGNQVAQGRIDRTQPMIFSADETADVGEDDATPVTEDYTERGNPFTGTIRQVTVALQPTKANVQSADEEAKKNAAFKKAMSD